MSPHRLRIGVVGAGKMGGYHLSKIKESTDAFVSGVYDVNEAKTLAASEKFETPPCRDLSSLLEVSDAVIVAASTAFHFAIAAQALDADVHVLIEKPATGHSHLATQLFQTAAVKKLALKIGFLERLRLSEIPIELFPRVILKVRAQRMSTSAARDRSVDILGDLMIHDLDIVANLIALDPVHFEARQWPESELTLAKFDFGHGVDVELQCTYSAKDLSRVMVIEGTDRRLFIDFQNGRYVEEHTKTEGSLPSDALALQLQQFISQVRENNFQAQAKQVRPLLWSESLRVALAPVTRHQSELPALIPADIFRQSGILA